MAQYVYTMNRVGKIVPPKRVILKDISLSFFPGAKIGVLGLNGSGKTSLLRIMAGADLDFEGEAIPMPNMRIGYLPQEPQLDPTKTVREIVEEGMSAVLEAKIKLDAIYAAYAEPDADLSSSPPTRRNTKRSARPMAPIPTCRWKSPPTRFACRRGTRKSGRSPAVKRGASHCAACCSPSRTCCSSTSRPTISMPRAWNGSSSSCSAFRAP
jgi:energy-coupling factor transporter ATP-binding protein EcfA2